MNTCDLSPAESVSVLRHGTLTLVLGGVRSGKSRFAQSLAEQLGGDEVLYIATAEPGDSEMQRRIAIHRQSRPQAWRTLETPLISQLTDEDILQPEKPTANRTPKVVLVDCATLLVSNVVCRPVTNGECFDATADFESEVEREVHALCDMALRHTIHVIVVSGEVGLGLVPESKLGRIFRDLLGLANQRLASLADASYFMLAGQPVPLPALACNVFDVAQQLKSAIAKDGHAT